MPPKKSKTQANANASASQPAPAPALERPTRAGTRKRRLSDASNASDRPSSSHSVAAGTPSKRRKRGKAAAEPDADVIIEEETENLAPSQPSLAPDCDAVGGADVITVTKHVHFGAAAEHEEADEEYDVKTTATHITPHPNKVANSRRTTTSPSLALAIDADISLSDRVKRTTRHSLPLALSQDGDTRELLYYVAEHEYAPLSEVLQDRIQHRMQQHAERKERIQNLEVELDGEQQKGNRRRVKEIEAELLVLRDEQKTALAVKFSQDVDMLDEDMLVLERQAEVAYPDLPTSLDTVNRTSSEEVHVRRSLRESRGNAIEAADARWEAERAKFGDALLALSKEANEAKAKLQVLEIEVQGLGLADSSLEAKDILVSIRESFSSVRERLSAALPHSIPEGATNMDLVEILVANIEEFSQRLITADQELQGKNLLVTDLSQQVQGLLDHLAEAEIRKQKLQERWNELDGANESKDRDIEDLQEEIDAITQERDDLQDALKIETEKVETLTQENVDFAANIQRLSTSLLKYQESEKHLQEVITRMEEEHATDVAQMNREREEIIRESDGRIHEQSTLREEAEQLAEERRSTIVNLELRIEQVEAERDATRGDLEHMTSLREEESNARETAEIDLKEKSDDVEDLTARVDRLEDELSELNIELDNLRRANENERTQREAAEADLDERNAEVEQLDQKVLDLGKQANELRQKLFEVQQANERKVQELERMASERDEQYQIDIAREVERRELADELGQERASRIEELETQLEEVEERMRALLAERDERIESLELQVKTMGEEIAAVRVDLKSVEDLYEVEVTQNAQRREELEGSIANLQLNITSHETTINLLRQEIVDAANMHTAEMDDRNAHIAELNHRIATEEVLSNELRVAKLSLEQRVEKEAAEMLQLQAHKDEEIESLKEVIRDKQAKILVVEDKAIQSDEQWQELLKQRDEDILNLTTETESSTQTVSTLQAEIAAMTQKFQDYVRRSSGKITRLQEMIAEANDAAAEDGEAIKAEGEQLLEQYEGSMSFAAGQVATTTTTTTTTTQASRQTREQSARKMRSKKKVKDSGIGMEEDELLLGS